MLGEYLERVKDSKKSVKVNKARKLRWFTTMVRFVSDNVSVENRRKVLFQLGGRGRVFVH